MRARVSSRTFANETGIPFYRWEQKDVDAKATTKMFAIVRSGTRVCNHTYTRTSLSIMRALFPETIVTLLSHSFLSRFLVGLPRWTVSMPSLAAASFFSRYRLLDVLAYCAWFSR